MTTFPTGPLALAAALKAIRSDEQFTPLPAAIQWATKNKIAVCRISWLGKDKSVKWSTHSFSYVDRKVVPNSHTPHLGSTVRLGVILDRLRAIGDTRTDQAWRDKERKSSYSPMGQLIGDRRFGRLVNHVAKMEVPPDGVRLDKYVFGLVNELTLGKTLANYIVSAIEYGIDRAGTYDEVQHTSRRVRAIMDMKQSVHGLGLSKAKIIYDECGIQTVAELCKFCLLKKGLLAEKEFERWVTTIEAIFKKIRFPSPTTLESLRHWDKHRRRPDRAPRWAQEAVLEAVVATIALARSEDLFTPPKKNPFTGDSDGNITGDSDEFDLHDKVFPVHGPEYKDYKSNIKAPNADSDGSGGGSELTLGELEAEELKAQSASDSKALADIRPRLQRSRRYAERKRRRKAAQFQYARALELSRYQDRQHKIWRDGRNMSEVRGREAVTRERGFTAELMGSYRRGHRDSGDIDVMLSHPNSWHDDTRPRCPSDKHRTGVWAACLSKLMHFVAKRMAASRFYVSVPYFINGRMPPSLDAFVGVTGELESGAALWHGYCSIELPDDLSTEQLAQMGLTHHISEFRMDIRWATDDLMGFARLDATGPWDLNMAMREYAGHYGWVLSEKGLVARGDDYPNVDKTDYDSRKYVRGLDEEEIFDHMGLDNIPPTERDSWPGN